MLYGNYGAPKCLDFLRRSAEKNFGARRRQADSLEIGYVGASKQVNCKWLSIGCREADIETPRRHDPI